MMIRSARTRLAVSFLAIGLILGGCGGSDTGGVEAGSGSIGTTNDINPHDPSELRDGGNLRLALSGFPPNFNTLSNDGNDTEIGAMLKPMMPRAFSTDASGALSVNHDYFTDVALTGTDPQQDTYTIDPDPVPVPPVSEPPQPARTRPMARNDTARRVRAERILMDVPFLEVR